MPKRKLLNFTFILLFIILAFSGNLFSQNQKFFSRNYNWELFFETSDKELRLYYDPNSMSFSEFGYIFVTTKAMLRGEDYIIVTLLLNCAMEEEIKFTYIAQKIDDRWIEINPNKPGIEEVISFYKEFFIQKSLRKTICRN